MTFKGKTSCLLFGLTVFKNSKKKGTLGFKYTSSREYYGR